jgi:hypothetical protein
MEPPCILRATVYEGEGFFISSLNAANSYETEPMDPKNLLFIPVPISITKYLQL